MAFVFSKVGICVLVVGYLLLGAFAFQAIEAPAEAQIKYNVKDNRTNTGLLDISVIRLTKKTQVSSEIIIVFDPQCDGCGG